MSETFFISWSCPSFDEYMELWSYTAWPQISFEDYTKFVAIDGSIVSARDDTNALIGFARVISDWCQYAYIQDVIVAPSRRREGVAAEMVAKLLEKTRKKNVGFTGLFSTKDGESLYLSLGFSPPEETIPLSFTPGVLRQPIPKSD